MAKPILLLDFDGVIHSYKSGWQGARCIPDPPVPGAIEFLCKAQAHFQVCIYSSRSRQFLGKWAMKRWLRNYLEDHVLKEHPEFIDLDPMNEDYAMYERVAAALLSEIKFPTKKPAAFLTIDDRAICFMGIFPDPKELLNFKPWNKKGI